MGVSMQSANTYEDNKIGQEINTIGQGRYPGDYPLHWHRYAEVVLMPENAVTSENGVIIIINQQEYRMQPGDVAMIWPGELHEIRGNHHKELMAIQFPVTLFTEIQDFAIYLNLFRSYHHMEASRTPELVQNLGVYIKHIIEIRESDSLFPTVEMLIALYEMFIHFAKYIHNQVKPGMDHNLIKIDQACKYIQENCEQEITLNQVAEYISFSPCYFSRLFKQTTQYSYVDYVNLQRVKRAQTYLADSSLNMTEISYQAGFRSISTFNRVFRQFRGCSPSDYRKYYSESPD